MADAQDAADMAANQAEGDTLADLIFNAEIRDKPDEEVQDTEQKATLDEFASVLHHPEEIPRNSQRLFSKELYNSFRSCQMFMSILGRFPIGASEKIEDHSIVFEFSGTDCKGIVFFATLGLLTLMTALCSLNIVSTMINFPGHPEAVQVDWDFKYESISPLKVKWQPIFDGLLEYPKWATTNTNLMKPRQNPKSVKLLRAEEMFIFRRNLASLLIVLFLMLHIVTCDWNLYQRRHFVASYMTLWTESVEIMKIDAAGEAKTFVKRFLIYYIIWFMVFCCVVASNVAPVSSGAPLSLSFLWLRCFFPSIHTLHDSAIAILRGFGGIVALYVIICSKVYVFFFLYICKLLTATCTVWNDRLEKVFTTDERKKPRKGKCESRTGFDHLFKDYVTILDLMSGADKVFTNILESYYSTALISIVFEVYYLMRPFSESQVEFSNARVFDMIVVGAFMVNSVVLLYLVSTGAAQVGEAAADGLEIIRRQGIMGHRSDSEMHFMISLYMSYTGHFDTALTGGGYFILDKGFCVAVAGTLLSYIIIIFQFKPSLGLANTVQRNLIDFSNDYNLRTLVMHVENTFYYQEDREPKS